jgi:hypothetical protein
MANIAGIASAGPILSCRSSTTMVENDIIEPTDRSRLPLITTKVTPSAITPRIAEERITLKMLSRSGTSVGEREADHEDREGDQDALPRQELPICCLVLCHGPAIFLLPLKRSAGGGRAGPLRPPQTSVMPPSIMTIWPVM